MAKLTTKLTIHEDWEAISTTEDIVMVSVVGGSAPIQIAVAGALADLSASDSGHPISASHGVIRFDTLASGIVFARCVDGEGRLVVTKY